MIFICSVVHFFCVCVNILFGYSLFLFCSSFILPQSVEIDSLFSSIARETEFFLQMQFVYMIFYVAQSTSTFWNQTTSRRALAISPHTLLLLREIRGLYFRVCLSHSRSVLCSLQHLQLQNFLSAAYDIFPCSISTAWAAFLLMFYLLILPKMRFVFTLVQPKL